MTGEFDPVPDVRIPYVHRCIIELDSRRTEAVICNLSTMGVYVTFLPPSPETVPEPGQTVRVSFNLPGDTAAVESAAIVAWQNLDEPGGVTGLPPGCGLSFTGLIP